MDSVRFMRTLATILRNGLALLSGVKSARQVIKNLEPVLILGLGGLIAIVIVGILVAMLGLNDLLV